jgi:uncharacterized Zn-finger protein
MTVSLQIKRIRQEVLSMPETADNPAVAERVIEVTRKELPLSCPRPQDELWNMHPRVYLPIDETGEEVCPYCGAHYLLVD